MHRTLILSLSLLLSITLSLKAQSILPIPQNVQDAYQSHTRDVSGQPGKNYWQNKADYSINVRFEPTTRKISGVQHIVYTNNSPDTLREIWFKLYPNFYQKGAARASAIKARDLTDGVDIQSLKINRKIAKQSSIKINGTNMVLDVPALLPKQKIAIDISWVYPLNKTSHMRTGEVDDGSYFVAYFFPRIAVYDDIDGWNKFSYNGLQEFYNDFCHFDVNITVPKNYVVWATGNFKNTQTVFLPKIAHRIAKAEKSDSIIKIIDEADAKNKTVTANKAYNTWHFTASNVTDFVFATSNHYVWKASSLIVDSATGRRTRVDAAFNPKHKDFEEVASFARQTVSAMSHRFPAWPYPYPHETIFDGLDQMEYPMMVNDNPLKDRTATIELTVHEIFHTMFPFYMGVNETKYAFMDEGWATMGEWIITPMIDSTIIDDYGVTSYNKMAGNEIDLPIITPSTQEEGTDYYLNSYPKPAIGYYYVRDMLGKKLFTKALHHYINTWKGKHPTPYDFFNCMNEGAGTNMNWFWKPWFIDGGYPDLALSDLKEQKDGYTILIESKGNKPTPINLLLTFEDGTTHTIHYSVAAWQKGNKVLTITFKMDKKIKKAELKGTYFSDKNKWNNQLRIGREIGA